MILGEYKKQKDKRDRNRFFNAVIVFCAATAVTGIFIILILAAIEKRLNPEQEVIYKNLKSCPKSSVVDYRQGEPFVLYKGEKIMIKREGCVKDKEVNCEN